MRWNTMVITAVCVIFLKRDQLLFVGVIHPLPVFPAIRKSYDLGT